MLCLAHRNNLKKMTHFESEMDREKQIEFLYQYIKSHKLAVISTVTGDALPHAAVIGISVNPELVITCATFQTSRKYHNLKRNPRVALVIGWEHGKTVQFEGVVEELNEDEAKKHLEEEFGEVPSTAKYVPKEYEVVYAVKPLWIRYSDFSTEPWQRFEVSFLENK